MKIRHIGLICRSGERAVRFYGDLLGLEAWEPKTLAADVSRALFDIDSGITVLQFSGEDIRFEIFVVDGAGPIARPPAHICLEVEDLESLLGRCQEMGFSVRRVRKWEKWITFIADDDGNLIEVVEEEDHGRGRGRS